LETLATIYIDSPVGVLGITANDHAILRLWFEDDMKELSKESLVHPILASAVQELTAYFNGSMEAFRTPLALQGTDFQVQVWSILRDIPYGSTISYGKQSQILGNPKSIRAVGTTNGKNPIVIMVPCHRVIGSNQDLIGFGGGLARKKWLLEHEKKHRFGVRTLF